MKTKIFFILFALIASTNMVFGWDYTHVKIGNLYYNLDAANHVAEVTSSNSVGLSSDNYSGKLPTALSIPSTISYNSSTYDVTSIGYGAFYYCENLKSIEIPTSVTSIGGHAFEYCSGLQSVSISDSITSIGDFAFQYCSGLTSPIYNARIFARLPYLYSGSYTMPDGIEVIAGGAFSYCTNLTSAIIPNTVTNIGDDAFLYCRNISTPVYNAHIFAFLPISYSGGYTIPNGLTNIAVGAFTQCTNLTSVTIPDSFTSLRDYVFKNCSNLTSVNIGHNVSNIGSKAFYGCNNLTTVTINSNILVSAEKANLGSSFGAQVTRYVLGDSVKSIGAEAFRDCSNMNSIVIPEGLESIGNRAFYGCTNLSNIVLPTSVQSIESETFRFCSNLRNISIPNSITNIGSLAFHGCSKLQNISISANVTTIGWSAFCDCTSLTAINVSDVNSNYCSIEGVLFNKDVSVLIQYPAGKQDSSYIVPNTVDTIGVSSFSRCEKLSSITIAVGVKSIETNAFLNCTNLCSIDIPKTVNTISRSFTGCSKLTMVSINSNDIVGKDYTNSGLTNIFGNQVKTYVLGRDINKIGKKVFRSCSNLTSINIPTNVTIIGDSAFHYCRSLCDLDLSNSSISSIGEGAFYGCQSLLSLRIPNSITSLGKYAFFGCNKLDTIYCESITPPSIGNYSFPTGSTLKAICVPCEAAENYLAAEGWASYASIISYQQSPYVINCLVKDTIGGIVTLPTVLTICENQIEAVPNYGYHFIRWNDGNTENPRTIVLAQDTTFEAEFAIDKSGVCGTDSALIWLFDDQSMTLTITGNGALTDNYTYGVEAPTQMNTLIIGDGVTAIGDSAFYGKTTLQKVVIGSNVTSIGNYAFADINNRQFTSLGMPAELLTIGDYAFSGNTYIESIDFNAKLQTIGAFAFNDCYRVSEMTCLATTTPDLGTNALTSISSYASLCVPAECLSKYRVDPNWGRFNLCKLGSSATTTDTNSVTVDPSDNTALFTWPTDSAATSYSLQITKDGVVFCTLIFNSNGQLTGIAFAPSRNGVAHAQAATMSVSAMSFTVTGLNSASKYAYRLSVTDESQNEIQVYSGEFATIGYEGDVNPGGEPEINTEGLEDVLLTEKATKILRDGQILILRGDKTYTLTGKELK